MTEIVKVAEQADMIINGYAFTKEGNDIRVLKSGNRYWNCGQKYCRQNRNALQGSRH